MNPHTHFDHAGGVREDAAEGITIITHEMNRSYYEKIWERPHTVKPDRLSQNPRTPRWETMTDRKTVTDGTRTLELYKLVGNGHNPYILIGYLPAERILLYGDMYNPPSGPDPRDGHKPRRDGQGVCGRRYCCVVATAAGFSPLAIRSTSFCAIGRLIPQLGSLMRQAARVSSHPQVQFSAFSAFSASVRFSGVSEVRSMPGISFACAALVSSALVSSSTRSTFAFASPPYR